MIKDVFIATDRTVEHLPWIYEGRVWKYWEKPMPTDYPESSSEFSQTFSSEEEKDAVTELEDTINDPDGVVADLIPATSYLRDYVGTYDVVAEPGVKTLLSPEKVGDADVIVAHYVKGEPNENEEEPAAPGEWVIVEDAEVIDGYVWGTLDSFSPVAVFKVGLEMVVYTSGTVIANGNPVLIDQDDNNDVYITNLNNNKKVKIPGRPLIIGGTYWTGDCKATSVTVKGVNFQTLGVFAGSYINPQGDPFKNETVKVTVVDSNISFVTGPCGAVKTDSLNYNFKDSIIKDYIGSGESIIGGKDAGTVNPDSTNKYANHNVSYNLDNVECDLVYVGGNCGYTWTGKGNCVAKNSKFGYYIAGGSNGTTEDSYIEATDCEIETMQSNNRGGVGNVSMKLKGNNKIANFFLLGDANDSTVNGTTNFVKAEIEKGAESNYNIAIGTQAGVAADQAVVDAVVGSLKISRGASFVISDADKKLLGEKLIIK